MTLPRSDAAASTIPAAFADGIAAYAAWLEMHCYRPGSIRSRIGGARRFAAWCGDQGIATPAAVTFDLCERYAAHLDGSRWRDQPDGPRLARATRANLLGDVREFFRYAARHGLAPGNPAADVERPLHEPAAPRAALTVAEVERVLAIPDVGTSAGLRDRAILETFYSTGIRRSELRCLTPSDVYADGGVAGVGGPVGGSSGRCCGSLPRRPRTTWRRRGFSRSRCRRSVISSLLPTWAVCCRRCGTGWRSAV